MNPLTFTASKVLSDWPVAWPYLLCPETFGQPSAIFSSRFESKVCVSIARKDTYVCEWCISLFGIPGTSSTERIGQRVACIQIADAKFAVWVIAWQSDPPPPPPSPPVFYTAKLSRQRLQSSGAVGKSRWPSWAFRPNAPYGLCERKATLNHASELVTVYP